MQVIFVSARSDIDAKLALYRAGAHHCLPRPLSTESLLALLERLFDQPLIEPFRALILSKDGTHAARQGTMLQNAGLHVQTSDEIHNVLNLLAKFDAEVIILDSDMGDLACLLRDHDEAINVVFQAAATNTVAQADCQDAEDDVLPPAQPRKPLCACGAGTSTAPAQTTQTQDATGAYPL